MRIIIPNNSYREDIHTIKGDIMTILSDQEINNGDEITCPHKITASQRIIYHVEEIIEKRRAIGDWKTEPPHLYKIKFRKDFENLLEDAKA